MRRPVPDTVMLDMNGPFLSMVPNLDILGLGRAAATQAPDRLPSPN